MTIFKSKYTALVMLLSVLYASKSFPGNWSGRVVLGGYASTERFAETTGSGSSKNDFQTLSGRFYLKGEGLGPGQWESITDLRDKHDFFDKLNKEKLTLEARNQFQIRQVSIGLTNPRKFWGFQLGRFPVGEVGAAHVDGLQVRNYWTTEWQSTYFAGQNPQQRDRSYLTTNPEAQIYGASLTYQRLNSDWDRNTYVSHGVVQELYSGHTDRNYIFHNLVYQWNEDSRFISLLYYDLVPRGYVQNGNLTWQQGWSPYFFTDLKFLTVDVIEYNRRQGVLETLISSPYSEGNLKLNLNLAEKIEVNRFFLQFASGRRQLDKLQRQSVEFGYIKSKFWGPNWDIYATLGTRKNFTSTDSLTRLGLGYFNRRWESNLDIEAQVQNNDAGTVTHPLIVDGSLSYLISRKVFVAISAQSASDENVKILSAFFKLGYRFGNRELPPLRDGAPPRGAL